jgi:effector-binding domain-containing protein
MNDPATTTYHCEVKEMPTRLVMSIRLRTSMATIPECIGQAYSQIVAYLSKHMLVPAGNPFVAYYNMDTEDLDIEAGMPVTRRLESQGDLHCREVAGGPAVAVLHHGPYGELTQRRRTYARK